MTAQGRTAAALRWRPCSFDVLNLFPDALELGFHLHHMTCDDGIVGFRADGVDLAAHFLKQEFERFANGFRALKLLLNL